MDMETSDEEDEDGQISKLEQEDEKHSKLFNKAPPAQEEKLCRADLEKCRLTRSMISRNCLRPWFGDLLKGNPNLILYSNSHLSRCMGAIPHWQHRRRPQIPRLRDLRYNPSAATNQFIYSA